MFGNSTERAKKACAIQSQSYFHLFPYPYPYRPSGAKFPSIISFVTRTTSNPVRLAKPTIVAAKYW